MTDWPIDWHATVDEAIRRRKEEGLSQRSLAALAGVSLPMLVRAFTYRTKGMETFVKKAVSGGCEGVLHVDPKPIYAAARSRDR